MNQSVSLIHTIRLVSGALSLHMGEPKKSSQSSCLFRHNCARSRFAIDSESLECRFGGYREIQDWISDLGGQNTCCDERSANPLKFQGPAADPVDHCRPGRMTKTTVPFSATNIFLVDMLRWLEEVPTAGKGCSVGSQKVLQKERTQSVFQDG